VRRSKHRKQLLDIWSMKRRITNHPELWLKFAHVWNSRGDAIARERSETKNLIDTFRSVCRTVNRRRTGCTLRLREPDPAFVSQDRRTEKTLRIQRPRRYRYFSVHIEADREHSAAERKMLSAYVDDQNAESPRGCQRTLDALWEMLSGVCAATRLPAEDLSLCGAL